MKLPLWRRRKKDNAELIENELKDEKNNLKLELNALKERLSESNSMWIFTNCLKQK